MAKKAERKEEGNSSSPGTKDKEAKELKKNHYTEREP